MYAYESDKTFSINMITNITDPNACIKCLYYVPFEGLAIDDIDDLNRKMRHGPRAGIVVGIREEIIPPELSSDDQIADPIVYEFMRAMLSLKDCKLFITIESKKSSPTQDVLMELCKRMHIPMEIISNNGQEVRCFDGSNMWNSNIRLC